MHLLPIEKLFHVHRHPVGPSLTVIVQLISFIVIHPPAILARSGLKKGIFPVKRSQDIPGSRIVETIESRSPAGRHDSVEGWHNLLRNLFTRMAPYLKEGHLITFRQLTDYEKEFFEKLSRKVTVPSSAAAIYLPPSVRFQMLYHRPEAERQPVPEHSAENSPDEGVVLASRKADFNVIINALLAKPPYAPAIDVYEDGQLLAGYVYNTINECIENLAKVIQTHLERLKK